ncbi:MAG: pilin [Candidatus Dojkabacteria bacterium]|nr:pilin [Candidatus Dojkabacteria bacterium]
MLDFSVIDNPVVFGSLSDFILNLINFAINLSIVLAVGALILAGFKYILAMGDEKKTEEATKSLIFAIVGLVIVFIAPLVVNYVTQFFITK